VHAVVAPLLGRLAGGYGQRRVLEVSVAVRTAAMGCLLVPAEAGSRAWVYLVAAGAVFGGSEVAVVGFAGAYGSWSDVGWPAVAGVLGAVVAVAVQRVTADA